MERYEYDRTYKLGRYFGMVEVEVEIMAMIISNWNSNIDIVMVSTIMDQAYSFASLSSLSKA